MARDLTKLFQSHAQDRIQIREDDEPGRLCMLAHFRREFQNIRQGYALLECSFAGALDYGTVGHGIAEGHTEFNYVGASLNRRQNDVPRGCQIRIATGDVCDEGGTSLKGKRHALSSKLATRNLE
jgi:hypothetical protein